MRSKLLCLGIFSASLVLVLLAYANFHPVTVDATESTIINAEPEVIWRYVSDFEGAFENSNKQHRGLEITSEPPTPFRENLKFVQNEYVGGFRGRLDGVVYDVYEPYRYRWKAATTYSLWGLDVITVNEGGNIRIEKTKQAEGYRVSHHVYGRFPDTFFGRSLSWLMTSFFGMQQAAAHHTRVELEFFRNKIEGQ